MKGKKIIAGILAVVSLTSIFSLAGCGWNKPDEIPKESETSSVKSYDGVVMKAGNEYALSSKMAFLASDMDSADETSAVVVSATVEPIDANQAVDWSLEFVNKDSEWAKGKTVTDYVTVTPMENESACTLEGKAPFGEQIKLVCRSLEDSTISAYCVIDCMQSMTGVSLTFGDNLPINLGGQTDVTWDLSENGVGLGGDANVVIESTPYTVENEYTWDIALITPEYYLTGEDDMNWGIHVNNLRDVVIEDDPKTVTNEYSYIRADNAWVDAYFYVDLYTGSGPCPTSTYCLFTPVRNNVESFILDRAEAEKLYVDSALEPEKFKSVFLSESSRWDIITDSYAMNGYMYTLKLTVRGADGTAQEYLSLINVTEFVNSSSAPEEGN